MAKAQAIRRAPPGARRRRELATLQAMLVLYCSNHHHGSNHHHDGAPLCGECLELAQYAERRLERCIFGDDKPTCANCRVHCYNAEMRERVRVMMRWAGPRMILRHPILALLHKLDGLRRAPPLARR